MSHEDIKFHTESISTTLGLAFDAGVSSGIHMGATLGTLAGMLLGFVMVDRPYATGLVPLFSVGMLVVVGRSYWVALKNRERAVRVTITFPPDAPKS